MTDDLDARVADALFDAAASTTVSEDALDAILRRADRPPRRLITPRVAVIGGCVAAVTVGTVGIVASRQPDGGAATSVAAVDTEPPAGPEQTLPTAGLVDGPLEYDDPTLLSILYVNFGVGTVEDESRMRDDPRSEAADTAMSECLEERGFQYVRNNAWVDELVTDPRWTLSPAEFAAQYGLGVAAQQLGLIGSGPADADPYRDYLDSLTPGEQEAYEAAEQECYSEHRDLLPVAPQAWISAHDYAHAEFAPTVEGDDRVVAALDDWRQCMGAAGYDFDSPTELPRAYEARLADAELLTYGVPPEPGTQIYDDLEAFIAEEAAVATTNVECVEPYNETVRTVIGELYPQYKEIFRTALDAGVESDAVG